MAKRALKRQGDNEHLHTTEAEFDKPEIGDVRIDRARKHNPDGSASAEECFRVYVYDERDETDFYAHKSNTPANAAPAGAKLDKDGFYTVDGQRVARTDTSETWLIESEHNTFEEAKAAAEKLA